MVDSVSTSALWSTKNLHFQFGCGGSRCVIVRRKCEEGGCVYILENRKKISVFRGSRVGVRIQEVHIFLFLQVLETEEEERSFGAFCLDFGKNSFSGSEDSHGEGSPLCFSIVCACVRKKSISLNTLF